MSKYTGNDKYRALAEKSACHIAQGGAPLPGLPGQGIDPNSGLPVGKYVVSSILSAYCSVDNIGLQTWGGGSDSYFEYLIKYARWNNSLDPLFADSWITAVDSSIRVLKKVYLAGINESLFSLLRVEFI